MTTPSVGIGHLHPFGFTAVVHVQKERQKSKVSPTGILCMFLGNVEGHRNFCLYDPNSKWILITHNCTFKYSENFWPLHSISSSSSLSMPLPTDLPVESMSGVSGIISDPEADGRVVDRKLDVSPTSSGLGTLEVSVPIFKDQYCSTQQPSPLEVGYAQSQAPLEKALPKVWKYGLVAETAPKDITSVISTKHIVPGKCTQTPPPRFSGVVINTAPCSFVEAMSSTKSNAWLNAMAKELASLE
ncbi:hypothetical protein O181_066573 [Austropuccinia psidii MF-1]|uniref:Retroviral polymerase SH3-like domain-containing protein n=1 Tax=Austropuccinia psidii MF-1 TaxID=1389203 RepID=A0A9Q3EXC8_9BASI|nr:hypothetical protein [Austropuccinia psidii MF-1]